MSNEQTELTTEQSGEIKTFETQDHAVFDLAQRRAGALAKSDFVPKQYQGSVANCLIALEMAERMKAQPLAVMQSLYIVHGTPAWSASFCIATVNTSGRFSPLVFTFTGENGTDDYGCTASAIDKETGEKLDGETITWAMVNAEGWASKAGSKWKTMPGQMFRYRAASFWIRAYAPEFLMGMQTQDEVIDINAVTVSGSTKAEDILKVADKVEGGEG